MTIQDAVGVLFNYGIQSDLATVASAGGTSQRIRRNPGITMSGEKATSTSPEVRSDQQAADIIDGPRSCSGSIPMPLATVACDDFIAAVMRNTWASAVALTQSDFTSLTISSGVVTLGGGNPSTLGLRIGKIYDLAGLSVTANNTRIRITAMTSTTFMAVKISDGQALADNGSDSSCSITEVGKSIIQGLAKTAFTFEKNFPDLDASQVFKKCRLGGMSVNLPAAGPCSITFPFTGLDWDDVSGASAPYFTNITAASETPVLEMAGGAVILNGTAYSVSDLNFSHAVPVTSNAPLVGSYTGTEIFHGASMLSGNLSFFLESAAQLALFRNGTVIDWHALATEAGGSFYGFGAQRVKLLNMQAPIPADGGVLIQSGFQGMKKAAGTGYDATTLTVQRSNP